MKKNLIGIKNSIGSLIAIILFSSTLSAQFIDDFNDKSFFYDTTGINGWNYFPGDGNAKMSFNSVGNGIARIYVDATGDKENIWWALNKRCISNNLDLTPFENPKTEFRIETRIKVSNAPKRVNLHLNTQRTTDFHKHLMEFDIPDTNNWHTISMTTKDFDVKLGDKVFAQLAFMDWGLENYKVDIDYFKVDVVNIDSSHLDEGIQVPYHPLVKSPDDFTVYLSVLQDATIDIKYPDMNFNRWSAENKDVRTILLSVSGTQFVILKWDLSEFKGKKVDGSGLFEFTTYSLERSPAYEKDFGMIRVSEIIGGEQNWDQESVTYDDFCAGQPLDDVINSQMIIDIEVNKEPTGKNFITIPNPVLQRMIDGKTLGLAVHPLGAIHSSFYAIENNNGQTAGKLHFNLRNNIPDSDEKK
jgi:hypothetical protein